MGIVSTKPEIQMVTFFLNQEEYGIDVMNVREIIGMTEITKSANSPAHIKGIINLRGSIVPVISLRNCFGMTDLNDNSTSCIAIMDIKNELTGFIIDAISDVIRIKRTDMQPPFDSVNQPWIEGIINQEKKLIVFLNLEYLV